MTYRERLKFIVEDADTFAGRFFDWAVILLIIYSIVTLTIETIPGLNQQSLAFLKYSEIVVTTLFTMEYALRIYVADRKATYLTSFSGIIDVVAILPFYVSLLLGIGGIDLRAVRSFRLFRIVRLLKIARYSKAMARFKRAFRIAYAEMILYLCITVILLYMAATGIYYFEGAAQPDIFKSIPHSLWWAVATLTTVGYGDVYPITAGGRFFTFVVLMVGLGIVAVPAGLVASALAQAREEEQDA